MYDIYETQNRGVCTKIYNEKYIEWLENYILELEEINEDRRAERRWGE